GWQRKRRARRKAGVRTLLAVNANRLHDAIGRDLEQLAVELEGKVVGLRQSRTALAMPVPAQYRAELSAEVATLTRSIEDLSLQEAGARAEKYRAAARHDDEKRDRAERDEEECRRQREEAERR